MKPQQSGEYHLIGALSGNGDRREIRAVFIAIGKDERLIFAIFGLFLEMLDDIFVFADDENINAFGLPIEPIGGVAPGHSERAIRARAFDLLAIELDDDLTERSYFIRDAYRQARRATHRWAGLAAREQKTEAADKD